MDRAIAGNVPAQDIVPSLPPLNAQQTHSLFTAATESGTASDATGQANRSPPDRGSVAAWPERGNGQAELCNPILGPSILQCDAASAASRPTCDIHQGLCL